MTAGETLELGGALPLRRHAVTSSRLHGFTYIAVLIAIALMGMALAGAAVFHHHQAQRAKEVELLFVGDQFVRAITSYYEKSPGGARRFPQKLGDLLQDTRYPVPVRHLRRIYRDPMTGSTDWGVVESPDKGITGIYSLSESAPLKVAGFPQKYAHFEGAESYGNWKFVYQTLTGEPQVSTVGRTTPGTPIALPPALEHDRQTP